MSHYKKVDSAGKAFNNIGYSVPEGPFNKIEFLRPYKFNIAFENASIPGYTTEKLFEAMLARVMPIYWGNPRVGEEFNTRSFLNYSDFPSEEALIEKIIELDQNEDKYLEYLRQPYFLHNRKNEYFSEDRILDFFERIFSTPIRPVSQRRSIFPPGRWKWVKQNKNHYHGPATS